MPNQETLKRGRELVDTMRELVDSAKEDMLIASPKNTKKIVDLIKYIEETTPKIFKRYEELAALEDEVEKNQQQMKDYETLVPEKELTSLIIIKEVHDGHLAKHNRLIKVLEQLMTKELMLMQKSNELLDYIDEE